MFVFFERCFGDALPHGLQAWCLLLEGSTDLSALQSAVLKQRLVPEVERLRLRVRRLGKIYGAARLTVTLGSILVPSLISLDQGGGTVRWCIWALGLLNSFCSACVSLFGVDRNYFTSKAQAAALEMEAWLFLSLAGRYDRSASSDSNGPIGHAAQFQDFVQRCEHMLSAAAHAEMPKPSTSTPPFQKKPSQNFSRPNSGTFQLDGSAVTSSGASLGALRGESSAQLAIA